MVCRKALSDPATAGREHGPNTGCGIALRRWIGPTGHSGCSLLSVCMRHALEQMEPMQRHGGGPYIELRPRDGRATRSTSLLWLLLLITVQWLRHCADRVSVHSSTSAPVPRGRAVHLTLAERPASKYSAALLVLLG